MKSVARFYDKDWKEIEQEKAKYIQLERWDKKQLVFHVTLVRHGKFSQ